MVIFIVLGFLFGAFDIAAQVGGHSLQDFGARLQVEAAYDRLDAAVDTYQTDTKACNQSLACVTGPARTLAPSFGTFVSTLEGISIPSSDSAAAARLVTAGSHAQTVFSELGASTSSAAYEEILQSNGPVLTQFSDAYNSLISQLG
jgi:hypothetical protein